MFKMSALVDLRYASRDLKAGDEFDVLSEADLKVLTVTGKAAQAPAEKQKRKYQRRDMTAKED